MSKQRDTTAETPASANIGLSALPIAAAPVPERIGQAINPGNPGAAAAPVPVRRPIGECLGLMIECPVCGKPTFVTDARGARTPTQVITSQWWVLTKCQGFCGSVLRKRGELVTVLADSMPKPVVRTLGEAVGHFVLCPRELPDADGVGHVCGARSQATWDMDVGHRIICPHCGPRATAGTTLVEVVG